MNFTQSRPMSVTDEEGDLLYGLVRVRKPVIALETGTGSGISARRVGEALARNGGGRLITCELSDELIAEARERVKGLPVEIRKCQGEELIRENSSVDFILVDSGDPTVRRAELKLLDAGRIPLGGIVVVHDVLNFDSYDHANRKLYDYSVLCQEMNDRGWERLLFNSPVGIAVYQRLL